MFSAYKCKICGAVSKTHRHLCQGEEMHSRTEYCATEMLHDRKPECETLAGRAQYQCEGCGRTSDEPHLLCRPQRSK